MLLSLQISCLLNSKATYLMQTNTMHFQSGLNPYLLPKEKILCDQFMGETVNLVILIGPYTFKADAILYSSLSRVILASEDANHDDIDLYTVAKFTLVLTKQLVDQAGQIDSFAIRRFSRTSCINSGIFICDDTKMQLLFKNETCAFDASLTQVIVQFFNQGDVITVMNQSAGVVDFDQIAVMDVKATCADQGCRDNLSQLSQLDAVFGYFLFKTEQKMTKKVRAYNNSGIDAEVELELTFYMRNLAQVEYMKSFTDVTQVAIFHVQKEYFVVTNFPNLAQDISGLTFIITNSTDFFSLTSPPQSTSAFIINCVGTCDKTLAAIHATMATDSISFALAQQTGTQQKILIPATALFTCISASAIKLYKTQICAVIELYAGCEFDFGVQIVRIDFDGLSFQGSFAVNFVDVAYCFESDSHISSSIQGGNSVGVVQIGTQIYPFGHVFALIESSSLWLGWCVFAVLLVMTMTGGLLWVLLREVKA
ncbi:hypothetical protein SS50377_25181 [Spironucleus salmonicida]|uniref:Transmembrane protein n=1 Tax=Spironucleus salmonicida TaxID=348837 RepID=V6LT21_9EUKA|nr:hypothetical protein SS50377_25173 [Spironucleus salmonicida]KAH0573063.1 hypothetical protein SS50377_25181 [Spironucleus salmonicida]|eukprot:EST46841.1 Hypothetical protein SS50377_13105 [Spironucleus salmonicida]